MLSLLPRLPSLSLTTTAGLIANTTHIWRTHKC
ncbi:hypothetical protein ORF045 [Yersinia phage PYps49T]|nr:hypothetical protein ORF045 [Yersinia phage PYps49T]